MEDQHISHYKILEKLGEGGMGVVYKARDTKLDRDVALKFLPQHLTSSEEDRQRFTREAKAAAALNHPNICTIYSADEHEGNQFIVMEYIDGNTLRDVQKFGNLEPELVIDYATQIAEALAEAHESDINHRADIFAFGVVLFEMLTGTRPFRGEHEAALMYSIVNEERVLVAPFENRTGDTSLDPRGRSAADWITAGISQSELVETVPTSTILHLIETVEQVGGGVDDRSQLRQLAEETAAGVVISGSIIQLGNDIQLQARIIDSQTGSVIHAIDPVRGPRSEPMEAVEELRRKIRGVLRG